MKQCINITYDVNDDDDDNDNDNDNDNANVDSTPTSMSTTHQVAKATQNDKSNKLDKFEQ